MDQRNHVKSNKGWLEPLPKAHAVAIDFSGHVTAGKHNMDGSASSQLPHVFNERDLGLLMYNRVPKTGSTTILKILKQHVFKYSAFLIRHRFYLRMFSVNPAWQGKTISPSSALQSTTRKF